MLNTNPKAPVMPHFVSIFAEFTLTVGMELREQLTNGVVLSPKSTNEHPPYSPIDPPESTDPSDRLKRNGIDNGPHATPLTKE